MYDKDVSDRGSAVFAFPVSLMNIELGHQLDYSLLCLTISTLYGRQLAWVLVVNDHDGLPEANLNFYHSLHFSLRGLRTPE